MRLYALRDSSNEAAGNLAYLECYERERTSYFELPPGADPWELPFILHEHAQREQLTIGADWSLAWVRSRLVPPERQNLGEVLRESGLDEYDELRLLELTEGRCSQDDCYLTPVDPRNMPTWYEERVARRVLDASPLERFRLAVTFRDGGLSVCDMAAALARRRRFARVITDVSAFQRVAVQPGGHGVRWGEGLLVSACELREAGEALPLTASDLPELLGSQLLDASEAAALLGCTRQNINDLVRRGRLTPIKATRHATLFPRSDLIAWGTEQGVG